MNATEYCEGCSKLKDGNCTVYADAQAAMRWTQDPKLNIGCSFNYNNAAAKLNRIEKKVTEKTRVGQQKQKKKK